jgi:hypothetical protein
MLLKDYLDQFKLTEITAHVNGSSTPPIVVSNLSAFGLDRFEIEFFDGVKLEKHIYKDIKGIPENLLQAKIVKTIISLSWSSTNFDRSIFKLIVSI